MSKLKSIIFTGIVTLVVTIVTFHYTSIFDKPQRVIIENLSDELIKLKGNDLDKLHDLFDTSGIALQSEANQVEKSYVVNDANIGKYIDESEKTIANIENTPTFSDDFTLGLSRNWDIKDSSDGWISYTDILGVTNSRHHEAYRENTLGYGDTKENGDFSYAHGGNNWLSLDVEKPSNYSLKVDIQFNENGFVENSAFPDRTFSRGGFFFCGSIDQYNIMRASCILLSANMNYDYSGVVTGTYNATKPNISCVFDSREVYSFKAVVFGNKGDAYLNDKFLCSFEIESDGSLYGIMSLGYSPIFTNFEFTNLDN